MNVALLADYGCQLTGYQLLGLSIILSLCLLWSIAALYSLLRLASRLWSALLTLKD
ncbi:hypothetical protein [Methylobacter sp. S3L5C]|uniref:hypothetical protein n=1 Tax=Methylobacter sp. S3L5C TaxID=2839024 RepID=UPI001FABAAC8|nr:hypothetical protein [Methylobacter sp. S3L5C]UOA07650.1 hypothetical protein KKZ03_15470 [Methylobacter sp. S3L5C]